MTGVPLGEPPEVELDYDPAPWEVFPREEPVGPRPQGHARVDVLGGELDPALPPRAEGRHDVSQVLARLREVVAGASSRGVRCRLDHSGSLQVPKSGGEGRSGYPWGSSGDLAERGGSLEHVPQDEWRPSLRQHFGGPGDRAVLPVSVHAPSLAPPGSQH